MLASFDFFFSGLHFIWWSSSDRVGCMWDSKHSQFSLKYILYIYTFYFVGYLLIKPKEFNINDEFCFIYRLWYYYLGRFVVIIWLLFRELKRVLDCGGNITREGEWVCGDWRRYKNQPSAYPLSRSIVLRRESTMWIIEGVFWDWVTRIGKWIQR